MHWLYVISTWIHLLSAIVWMGGMAFLALVLVPALRQPTMRKNAAALIIASGRRFKLVGWTCLGVLVLTGIGNLYARGMLGSALSNGDFWTTPYGKMLFLKLCLVSVILVLSLVHDFYFGPKAATAMKENPEAPETKRLRRAASWIGRMNILLALAVTLLGVMLVRGRPW